MLLFFTIARPDTFPTIDNAKSILVNAAPGMIVALGLTVVLVMGDFDLSIGSMVGFAAGAAVALMVYHGVGWQLAIVLVILDGARRRHRQRTARARLRRELIHHDARDGHHPDRAGIRVHGPGHGLPGVAPGVHRPRRQVDLRAQQPGLDRPRRGGDPLDPARRHRARPVHVRDRRQPGGGAPLGHPHAPAADDRLHDRRHDRRDRRDPDQRGRRRLHAQCRAVPAVARLRRRLPRRSLLPARRVQHPRNGRRRPLPRHDRDRIDAAQPSDVPDQPRPGRDPDRRRPAQHDRGRGEGERADTRELGRPDAFAAKAPRRRRHSAPMPPTRSAPGASRSS